MAGKDVYVTHIGDNVKVEIRDEGNPYGTLPNYGYVRPEPDDEHGALYHWGIASGQSGQTRTQNAGVNAAARAIRKHAEEFPVSSPSITGHKLPELSIHGSPNPSYLVHIALVGMMPRNYGHIKTGPGDMDVVVVMRLPQEVGWVALHVATLDMLNSDSTDQMVEFICGYVVS